MNRYMLLATGKYFIGSGVRAIEPVILEIIESARNEIIIASYLFTPAVINILELIEKKARAGIKVTIIINRIDSQPQEVRKWFMRAVKESKNLRLVDYSDPESPLHAKVIVVDRSKAIVGSANFTWGGMTGNHELAVYLEGEMVWKLAALMDRLSAQMNK